MLAPNGNDSSPLLPPGQRGLTLCSSPKKVPPTSEWGAICDAKRLPLARELRNYRNLKSFEDDVYYDSLSVVCEDFLAIAFNDRVLLKAAPKAAIDELDEFDFFFPREKRRERKII